MYSSDLAEQVKKLVKETGLFIQNELGKVNDKDIETKEKNSLVSYVDKRAEEMLVDGLKLLIPDCGFVTEEDTKDDDSKEYVWIIDPLDGTTNFLREIPHFSVSVALKVQGEILLGCVYHIPLDEMFFAEKGKGSFLNEKQISVSKTTDFSEAIIATGFPYNKINTNSISFVLEKLLLQARGIRRMGSAALDLAYVASGRLDAYYECCINAWDVAAGIILVKEAGGAITDFSGGENYYDGKEVLTSTPACHEPLLQILIESGGLNK